MKKITTLLCLLFILSALTACSFEEPYLERVSKVKILNVQDNKLTLQIIAIIRNTNNVSATLTEVKTDIYLYDKIAGSSILSKEIQIKADDTTSVILSVILDLPMMSEIFPKMLAEDSTLMTMTGIYKMEKWFFTKNIEKTSKCYLHTKDELQKCMNDDSENLFKITSFMPVEIGTSDTKFNLTAEIKNPYPFSYNLEHIDLSAVMENTRDTVGIIHYSIPSEIKAKGSQQIVLTADLLYKGFFSSIGDVLFGGTKYMVINGTATISINGLKFTLPVMKKQKTLPELPGKF